MGNCCESKTKDTDGQVKPVSFATPLKDKSAPYCRDTTLIVKPDRRDDFLEKIHELQEKCLEEPLALMYRFGEDESCENTFHIFEQYKGEEGFKAHSKAAHLAIWDEFAATDPFMEPPQVDGFYEIRPSTTYHGVHFTGHHTGHRGHLHVTHHGKDQATETVKPSSGVKGEKLYCVNVSIKIKPTRREGLLQCIRANQQGTLNEEPLAASYVYGEDDHCPNTFHFHEQYKGPEGFEEHKKTKHFLEWEKFASNDPFDEPPKVVFFTES
eukprot:gnl/MRDRNA2_/MRDRNA2_153364_c0_seq1.p1 gnl/MRDRNA2_/MRDRNA2_153364_c0~~gnl/MRDRNA2_/MRDRNA2_153364_c0_seq1.p1  ORF type:complete len:268 (+),score=52.68 gnl/MRDRNA2_/MRDRNA2_153364_c0_seq1:62-865(+)